MENFLEWQYYNRRLQLKLKLGKYQFLRGISFLNETNQLFIRLALKSCRDQGMPIASRFQLVPASTLPPEISTLFRAYSNL